MRRTDLAVEIVDLVTDPTSSQSVFVTSQDQNESSFVEKASDIAAPLSGPTTSAAKSRSLKTLGTTH